MDERRRDVALRERAAEKAEAGEGAWAEAWSTTCRSYWLADTADVPAISVVREILVAIADLAPAIEKRSGLVDRIEKMEKDQAAFRDEVASLAGGLGIPVGTEPIIELAQRIGEKVREAGAERDRRAKLLERLEQARERQRALAETLAIHDEQKHRMTAFFEVVSLAEVSDKLSDISRRAELRGQAEDAGREILDAVRGPDLQSAGAALDAADRSALEAELIELRARFED